VSPKGKRLGDVFAGTMVISERAPKSSPPPPMPPALAWWAASLQLSGLRPEQADQARHFLSRAPQLEPALREQLANRLCADVVAQLSPPPPPGAPAALVLAAVLAERHRRELMRLRPPVAATPGYAASGHASPAYPPPGQPLQAPAAPQWGQAPQWSAAPPAANATSTPQTASAPTTPHATGGPTTNGFAPPD
jgi:hypothetical protein